MQQILSTRYRYAKANSIPFSAITATTSAGTAGSGTGDGGKTETTAAANATAAKTNGISIKADTKKDGTAVISEVKKTSKKTITIPSKIKVKGVSYKVTAIDAKALRKCTKATKLILPDSIKTIKKNAFHGMKKLKKIHLKSKKSITVKPGAFKGLNTKKMTITVNKKISKKQLSKLKKTLKKAGFKGKVKKG